MLLFDRRTNEKALPPISCRTLHGQVLDGVFSLSALFARARLFPRDNLLMRWTRTNLARDFAKNALQLPYDLYDRLLLSLQMNVPLYGVLGAAAALLAYIFGIGTIVKLLVCLLVLILG